MSDKPKPQTFAEFKEWAKQEDPEAAIRAEQAASETRRSLKSERDLKPEKSSIDPNKLRADKDALANRIIYRSGGGEVLANKVTRAEVKTPSGAKLWAAKTSDGSVLGIGLIETEGKERRFTELHTGSLADKTGGLNEFLKVEARDADDKSSGMLVSIGFSEQNFGMVSGDQWFPDEQSGEMSRPPLTRENCDTALNTAMANIAAAVDSIAPPPSSQWHVKFHN